VTTLSSRIGVEQPRGWGIYLWGDNLTDQRRITGFAGGRLGLSTRNYFVTPPRTYGVELRARF
jgi:outer membrane receptor protein involved in Fe transport